MNDMKPFAVYAEEQLSTTGLCVLDVRVARFLRPGLMAVRGFSMMPEDGFPAGDEYVHRLVRDARERGQLYSVKLKGRAGPVPLVARSKARLGERLGWLGIEVEALAVADDEPAPVEAEPVPEPQGEPAPYPFGRARIVRPERPPEVPEVRMVR